MKLKTKQEMEQIHGELVNTTVAYKTLGITRDVLENAIENGAFKGTVFVVGRDVEKAGTWGAKYLFVKSTLQNINISKEFGMKSREELEEIHGTLIPMVEAAHILKMAPATLQAAVNDGFFHDVVFVVGKDVRPSGVRAKCFFIEKKLYTYDVRKELGYSLDECVQELSKKYDSVNRRVLDYWSRSGYLDEGRVPFGRQQYELEWVLENYERIAREVHSHYGSKLKENSVLKHLSDEQMAWIKKHVRQVINGMGVRVQGVMKHKKAPDKPDKVEKHLIQKLSVIFFKINRGRCGLPLRQDQYKMYFLSEEDLERYDPNIFHVIDFTPNDMQYVLEGWSHNHAVQNMHIFKSFLYFVLQDLKDQWLELKQKSLYGNLTEEEARKLQVMPEQTMVFEGVIESAITKAPSQNIEPDGEDARPAYHMSRQQMLMALNNIRNLGFNDPIQRATVFMSGCLLGPRNDELAHLKISDFKLNGDKLLQRFHFDSGTGEIVPTNERTGFGLLHIKYSKGGYGKSPKWGTYVAPALATQINEYLTLLYQKVPRSKGKGYLFRPNDRLPDVPYGVRALTGWISDYRNQIFDFVPEEERKTITYYDVRHSVAEMIYNQTVLSSDTRDLERKLLRVAQLHIRHDMKNTGKSVLEQHYAKDTGAFQYFTVIQQALDFPWAIDGLKSWEFEHGHVQEKIISQPAMVQNELDALVLEAKRDEWDELNKELTHASKERDKLYAGVPKRGKNGKQVSRDEWYLMINEAEEKVRQIQTKIDSMATKV